VGARRDELRRAFAGGGAGRSWFSSGFSVTTGGFRAAGIRRPAHYQHGGIEHGGPCADVDRAGHGQPVAALELKDRALCQRPEDPVNGEMGEWKHFVQPPLRRRY
jgi:hypothetical protein